MVTCFVKGLTYGEKTPLHITPVLAARLVAQQILKPTRKLGTFTLAKKDSEDTFWLALRRVW